MADFSSNLKRIRKRENLSQELLAEKLMVTRQTISNWERGNSYPDLDMLVQISETLNTNPNELLYPPVKEEKSYMDRLIKTIWGWFLIRIVFWKSGIFSSSQYRRLAFRFFRCDWLLVSSILDWYDIFGNRKNCCFAL